VSVPLARADISTASSAAEEESAIATALADIQRGLDPTDGPTMCATLLDFGPLRPAWVLVGIHALVVDGPSWPIITDDIGVVYDRLSRGAATQLPPKTTSYKRWVEAQMAAADDPAIVAEASFWAGRPWSDLPRLPRDGTDMGGPARTVSASLSSAETDRLLAATRALGVSGNELLVAALAWSLARWARATNVGMTIASHGRDSDPSEIDVSRTVGAFVAFFPALFDLTAADEPHAALVAVRRELSRLPAEGRHFMLLRHASADPVARRLRDLPLPEVTVNYRGQFARGRSMLSLVSTPRGPAIWERVPQPAVFTLTGSIIERRLWIDWEYHPDLHRKATVDELLASLLAGLRALAGDDPHGRPVRTQARLAPPAATVPHEGRFL
jgi:non-ribosomal peptide synthase protein (TIGR01720 family)